MQTASFAHNPFITCKEDEDKKQMFLLHCITIRGHDTVHSITFHVTEVLLLGDDLNYLVI